MMSRFIGTAVHKYIEEAHSDEYDNEVPVAGFGVVGTADIVYKDGNAVGSYKLPSTPDDPARAVLEGLSHLFSDRIVDRLTYGTTVATNAMLQRTAARVALFTTAGFEDVIEIGRQNRPELYCTPSARRRWYRAPAASACTSACSGTERSSKAWTRRAWPV